VEKGIFRPSQEALLLITADLDEGPEALVPDAHRGQP
jgi:hypothetical protein